MVRTIGYNSRYSFNNVFKNYNIMDDKLRKYLEGKKLDELASLRGLVASICNDYDKNLTNYAEINNDRAFNKMPGDIALMHERRNKLFSLLMSVNNIIEDKLFKLYE